MSDCRAITINDIGNLMPALDTLPQRMRFAADVLVETTQRYHQRDGGFTPMPTGAAEVQDWRAINLRYVADQFEQEDAEARKAHQMEGELALYLRDRIAVDGLLYTEIARDLIAGGWTKQEVKD